jgi:hypothetical protein
VWPPLGCILAWRCDSQLALYSRLYLAPLNLTCYYNPAGPLQTSFEAGSAVIGLGKAAMAEGKTTAKGLFIKPGARFSERHLSLPGVALCSGAGSSRGIHAPSLLTHPMHCLLPTPRAQTSRAAARAGP